MVVSLRVLPLWGANTPKLLVSLWVLFPALKSWNPTRPQGCRYLEAACSQEHTLLLRSDGAVLALGDDYAARCQIPALRRGTGGLEIPPRAIW